MSGLDNEKMKTKQNNNEKKNLSTQSISWSKI